VSRLVWLAAGLMLCTACGGSSVEQQGARVRTIGELTETAKARLATQRIFFGHQSVGGNIMDGVGDLVREQPTLGLRVLGLDGVRSIEGGFFAHAKVGRNEYPATKTDEFAKLLDEGLASRVDIAFHKYCFADILENTDTKAVFQSYQKTMARLRDAYPNVTFVHVTAPLMAVQSGPKALVKKLLGRAPDGYQANFRREQFNELMRREYTGREPLFDLAAIESSAPDGTQATIAFKGTSGRALFPPYTSDGGHLNEIGRRRVAEELVVLLAQLPASK